MKDTETSEGLELSTAVSFFSRQIFIRKLLPLLRVAASSDARQYSPRIVNVLGTGTETANLFLDDLTLKEPGHFSIPSYMGHSTTMTSVSLKRLAEQPENKDIVIIHHHPGLVATDILKKSWGDQWDESKPPGGPPPPNNLSRSTAEEAGWRSLYVATSARYGGSGNPLLKGQKQGSTVLGTDNGSLICVGDKLDTLQLDGLLDSLEKSRAAAVIWNKTNEVVGKYL